MATNNMDNGNQWDVVGSAYVGGAGGNTAPTAAPGGNEWDVVDTKPVAPPAASKPGLWQRFKEGINLPSLSDIKNALMPTASGDTPTGGDVLNSIPAYRMAKNYATTAGKGIKEGYNEVKDAAQNDIDAGRTLPSLANMGKAAYGVTHAALQAVPFVGPQAENVGNDIAAGNTRGAVGGAAGVLGQAALPAVAEAGGAALGKVKGALSVPPELQAAAGEVPNAETAAKAARTATDIKNGAAQELNQTLHGELDAAAGHAGVDVSDAGSASVKAHRIGDHLQKSAQEMYSKADEIAKQVTGQPGRFQDIAANVKDLRDEVRFSRGADKIEAQKALDDAQAQYDTYKQQLEAAGMDLKFVKQADKQWSIGTSYKEVGGALRKGERLSGDLAPTANPLDAQIKNLSVEGAKRGHVLANAMGDEAAGRITDAVQKAGSRVAAETAETRAAKESVKATQERAGAAQKRIDSVRSNRKTLTKGAVTALGATAAAKYGGALFGTENK